MGITNVDNLDSINYNDFKSSHDSLWQIECYRRALKQACSIEKFQVRQSHAIRNHIYCALRVFCKLEILKAKHVITNWNIKLSIF